MRSSEGWSCVKRASFGGSFFPADVCMLTFGAGSRRIVTIRRYQKTRSEADAQIHEPIFGESFGWEK